MDFKEKYNAALRRAKKLYGEGTITECLGWVFPELKESEDEEIRKWCISHFKGCINVIKDNDEYKEYLSNKVLAWLEKQKPIDEEELKKGALKYVARQFMKWLDAKIPEDEMCLSNMECEDIENAVLNADWAKVYRYMKKKLEKQCEQTHVELAENEDDRNDVVKCLINGMKFYYEDNKEAMWGTEKFSMKVKDILNWLEKQGKKSVNIDIEPIISSYKQRLKSQGSIENTPLFDMCLTAFRHGVENVLEELNLKALDPEWVIEWLKTKVYDDSTYGMAMIDQFKKDFGL